MLLYIEDMEILGRAVVRMVALELRIPAAWHEYPVDPIGYDIAILDWQPHGPEMVKRCVEAKVKFLIYTGMPDGVDRSLLPDGTKVLDKAADPQDLIDAIESLL